MKTYEHIIRTRAVPTFSGPTPAASSEWDRLGAEGWALVAVVPGRIGEVLGFFRRETLPENIIPKPTRRK